MRLLPWRTPTHPLQHLEHASNTLNVLTDDAIPKAKVLAPESSSPENTATELATLKTTVKAQSAHVKQGLVDDSSASH